MWTVKADAACALRLQAKAGITPEIAEHMAQHSKELSKGRKKRTMPAGLASREELENLTLISSHPLHKSTKARIHSPPSEITWKGCKL